MCLCISFISSIILLKIKLRFSNIPADCWVYFYGIVFAEKMTLLMGLRPGGRRENSIGNTVYTIGKIACSIRRRIYTTDASSRLFLSPFFYHSSASPSTDERADDTNHAPFSFSVGYFYFFSITLPPPCKAIKHICDGCGRGVWTSGRAYGHLPSDVSIRRRQLHAVCHVLFIK